MAKSKDKTVVEETAQSACLMTEFLGRIGDRIVALFEQSIEGETDSNVIKEKLRSQHLAVYHLTTHAVAEVNYCQSMTGEVITADGITETDNVIETLSAVLEKFRPMPEITVKNEIYGMIYSSLCKSYNYIIAIN